MKLLDIINAPWAIQPGALREIERIYTTHLRGEKIDLAGIEARIGQPLQNEEQGFEVVNSTAVIPVHGVIAKRMNLFSRISGGASTELAARDIQQALADDAVESIILDIDSPGGTVDGTAELAAVIDGVRGVKPIHAFANGLMASAAYWIGSAADSVRISGETATIGSIGVVATHVDVSRAQEALGVRTTEITAGRFKRIASQFEPLSESGRQSIQDEVDYVYSLFVTAVADNRGVTVEQVLENMADGRIFIGQQAIDAGLVDGFSTLDQLITDLSVGRPVGTGTEALTGGIPRAKTSAVILTDEDTAMNEKTDQPTINIGYLKVNHADLVEQIRAEGFDDGHAKGATEGAESERTRIQGVRAQAMPGHEALIDELSFDGKTTGPEAAVKILQAENKARTDRGTTMIDDAPKPATITPIAGEQRKGEGDGEDTTLPIKDRAKAAWDKDADLRAEFGEFETYLAYRENEGNVKVLGSRTG